MHRGDDSAYDACQTGHTESWHKTLYGGKVFTLGIGIVEKTPDSNGNYGYNKDVEEHAYGVDFNDCACGQLHQQWGHDRGK